MNRELRTECPLCASALYVGDTCPQHCSVLDVAEVFEQRIAHIQKALNERELELLRVKARLAVLEPVWEAAKKLHRVARRVRQRKEYLLACRALYAAIDTAIASEQGKER